MTSLQQALGYSSFCGCLRSRELLGSHAHARPFLAARWLESFQPEGCVLNAPNLMGSPAFACQYSQVYNDGKLLALADEEGFVSILDTTTLLPRSTGEDGEPRPRAQWLAHKNAVFDIAWAKGDTRMLAASGDRTVSLWDTGLAAPLGTFRGHTGSVKSVCPQPVSNDVFASGARDGVVMVWDARVPAVAEAGGEPYHNPVAAVQDTHAATDGRPSKSRRTPLQGRNMPSVTSVLFAGGATLATGGVDGILKLYDLRQLSMPLVQQAPSAHLDRLCSVPLPSFSIKQHGITSLALHPNGVELLVSLTGGHHLMYQLHRPSIGPTKLFGGHTVASFYVKAAFSPDGSHILSGSTDRRAYIWQVDGSAEASEPLTLAGHEGEVTAVAWCSTDAGQLATAADDATVRVWSVRRRDRSVREAAEPVGWGLHRHLQGLQQAGEAHSVPSLPERLPGSPSPGQRHAAPSEQLQPNEAHTPAPSTGQRPPRSLAELHVALGSQQRLKRTRQQSIAGFLSPPPPPAAAAAEAAAEGAGGKGSPSSTAAAELRKLPLSPRLKRLQVSLDPPQSPAGGSGGQGNAPGSSGGVDVHSAGTPTPVAAAAASQLEPSGPSALRHICSSPRRRAGAPARRGGGGDENAQNNG